MISIDTQVLTLDGWKSYQELQKSDAIINYNDATHSFSYAPIGMMETFDYNSTAFTIQSEMTDQLVSLEHRCLLGAYNHAYQEALLLQQQEYMPVVVNDNDMLQTLRQWETIKLTATPYLSNTHATVMPIHYRDVMWSVSSPTGFYLARRNDMVFITG